MTELERDFESMSLESQTPFATHDDDQRANHSAMTHPSKTVSLQLNVITLHRLCMYLQNLPVLKKMTAFELVRLRNPLSIRPNVLDLTNRRGSRKHLYWTLRL